MKKQLILAAFICLGSSLLISGCGDDFNISPCRKGEREHHHDDNDQHHHHDSTAVNTPAAATQSSS